jgi:hypothetical protein
MSEASGRLEPDALEVAGFVHALFRYADEGSFVSFRAFLQREVGPPPYIHGSEINGAGLDGIIEDAVVGARFAANYREPLVFAPPIATFRSEHKAAEADLINGLCISVELDEGNTTKTRQFLEHLLGPATCVVASGGEWVDPETGEVFAKLHLHWRLSEPTRTPGEHAELKHARRLACALVKADPTATTSVHPLRWPGSWHLKGAQKLTRSITINEAAELHLAEGVEALEAAAEAAGLNDQAAAPQPNGQPQAPVALVRSALAAMANADEHWDQWIKIGLATFAATAGSADGLEAWAAWSMKSAKYVAGACDERWDHFRKSPPSKIGFGTIAFWAKVAGWERPALEPQASIGQRQLFFDPWAELEPPTFPIDALPPVLRAFAEDRSTVIGADPAGIAWAAISAASAALDGSIRLRMKLHDLWSVPPAIWVALIGRPSTKKTPSIDAAWEPLKRAQKVYLDEWRRSLDLWKVTPKKERSEHEPTPKKRFVSNDGTMEALQEILGRQNRGVGVLRDELSGWLGQLEKYAGAKAASADRAFFLQAFEGGSGTVDRISRGLIAIDNLLVTICGGIQPERLKQFSDLTDDGLWQRFVPMIIGPAAMGADEQSHSSAVSNYENSINHMLAIKGPITAQLCNSAHEIRAEVQRKVFELEQRDVLGARFASFCGKLVGLWGRLCLVLNYLDPPDGDTHFIIPQRTAKRATELLFQSVIPSAARVYAATGGAGADSEATRSVAGYILVKEKNRVLASDLARSVRACRGQPLEIVQKVVSPLVAGGWLIPEKDWNPFAWKVDQAVHGYFEARRKTEDIRRAAIRNIITGNANCGEEDE